MILVADLMTADPVVVHPADTLQHAAQLMDDLNVGALPVCVDGQVLGIVTDRDITVRATAVGLDPASTSVDLVMSHRVRCCFEEQTPDEVLQQMASVQIRRMPVLDDADRLVGMLSLGDLSAQHTDGVEQTLREISTPSAPDRAEPGSAEPG